MIGPKRPAAEAVCARRAAAKKLEIETLRKALERAGGNNAKAAKLMGMGMGRATFYRFLNDHPPS